jgi:hypothetical protein
MELNDHAQKLIDYYATTYGNNVAAYIRREAEGFAESRGLAILTLFAVLWGAKMAGVTG